jgi:PII-like signaling protein
MIVNIIGSFIIGFFATLTGPDGRVFADTLTRQFVMIDVLLLQLADPRPGAGRRILARLRQHRAVRDCLPVRRMGRLRPRRLDQRPQVDLTMALSRDAVLLRIFIGEDDKADHRPLYEAIVLKAREMHLAGATVLRGPMGFGHSSVLHTTKIVRLSQDLPLVIEIVDSEEAINSFVDAIEGMMGSALVTTEKVKVIQYGTKRVE